MHILFYKGRIGLFENHAAGKGWKAMCGIAGFCDVMGDYTRQREKWMEVLRQMRESIAHRGRDQSGEYLMPHAGLSHARLSIRDVAGGRQPMVRSKDGRRCAIVYNGEIYNAEELKGPLEKAGCRFETTADTEVILWGYIERGEAFFRELNGIYAFAIWDEALERLVLVRDRAGVKPLFYAQREGELIFGSEPKALFRHPAVEPEADMDSFREIFGIGPARTSGCGVFKGVREVRPGCCGVLDREGFHETAYWRLQAAEHTESYPETVEHVAWLVRDAVRRQMVSDVPVCSFLSGGVDSSIVTALASGYMEERGQHLNTFSFDFIGNDRYFQSNSFQPEQDRPYVDRMLAACPALRHTYLECGEEILADLLTTSVEAKDLPGMADVDASLLYFCRMVKEHNKVALTGECADEIFGGYPWFYREELLAVDGFPWSHDMAARQALLREEVCRELRLEEYAGERCRQSLAETPKLPGEPAEEERRREIAWLNLRWFMQTLLDRMDRASMFSGLEARVPFADHRIIEYLYNVPWSMKYRPGEEKALLRDACGGLLPPQLLHRKKSPYPKTYSPRYQQLVAERFRAILLDANAPIRPLLDQDRAEKFLRSPVQYGRPWFGQLMAGPQMLAYLIQVNAWMERFHLSL